MNIPAAFILTSTPILATLIQAAIPQGHEAASYWVSYGSFAILAWAAYATLNKIQKQAAEERKGSEERMARLISQVLSNESRGYDVISMNSERLGELTGAVQRCIGQPQSFTPHKSIGQPPTDPR